MAKRLQNAIITNVDYLTYVVHRENTKKYKNIGINNYQLVAFYSIKVVSCGAVNSVIERSRNKILFFFLLFFLLFSVARLSKAGDLREMYARTKYNKSHLRFYAASFILSFVQRANSRAVSAHAIHARSCMPEEKVSNAHDCTHRARERRRRDDNEGRR